MGVKVAYYDVIFVGIVENRTKIWFIMARARGSWWKIDVEDGNIRAIEFNCDSLAFDGVVV